MDTQYPLNIVVELQKPGSMPESWKLRMLLPFAPTRNVGIHVQELPSLPKEEDRFPHQFTFGLDGEGTLRYSADGYFELRQAVKERHLSEGMLMNMGFKREP